MELSREDEEARADWLAAEQYGQFWRRYLPYQQPGAHVEPAMVIEWWWDWGGGGVIRKIIEWRAEKRDGSAVLSRQSEGYEQAEDACCGGVLSIP